MRIKNIEISSPGDFIKDTTHILCYNKRAFTDAELIDKLVGISDSVLNSITRQLTINSLSSLINIFFGSQLLGGLIIKVKSSGVLEIDNDNLDILSNYGADTFIFLKEDKQLRYKTKITNNYSYTSSDTGVIGTYSDSYDPIGFIELEKPVGDDKNNPDTYTSKIRIDFNKIFTEINSDHKEGNKVPDIYLIESKEGDSERLKKYYETVESFKESINSKILSPNYRNFISDRAIFDNITDSLIIKYDGYNIGGYKLDLLRELTLPTKLLKQFDKLKVGIYQGEPALYLYSSRSSYLAYDIISLQHTLSESFDNSSDGSLKYLGGEYACEDEDYHKIYFTENVNITRWSIDWAGNYAVVTAGENRYLFDTRLNRKVLEDTAEAKRPWVSELVRDASGEYVYKFMNSGSLEDYEGSNPEDAYIREYPSKEFIINSELGQGDVIRYPKTVFKLRTNNFLLDELDYKNKIETLWIDKCKTGDELTKFNPGFSKLFGNIPSSLVSKVITPIRRVGSWYMFEDSTKELLFVVNRTMCICLGIREYEPIPINSKCLLLKDKVNKTYYYFKNSGFWCTEKVEDLVNQGTISMVSFGEKFKVGGYSEKIKLSSFSGNKYALTTTALERFRRNRLPDYPWRIEIIGAIDGIIYYKDSNRISYL